MHFDLILFTFISRSIDYFVVMLYSGVSLYCHVDSFGLQKYLSITVLYFKNNLLIETQPIRQLLAIQGRIQADAWKPGLQRDFFKYGISPGLSEKKL